MTDDQLAAVRAFWADKDQTLDVPLLLGHIDALTARTTVAAGDDDLLGAPFTTLKDIRQMRALRILMTSEKPTIKAACAAAGVSYSTWYHWLAEDEDFANSYERMLHAMAGELEPDVMARARESDQLAMFILKAWKPARYRDRQVIEVVSPDVQLRLAQQVDAIISTCQELLSADQAAVVVSGIRQKMDTIWATDEDRKQIAAGGE